MIDKEVFIERLTRCALACQKCSDECLRHESMLSEMVDCVRLCRDCGEACVLTINFFIRDSRFTDNLITLVEELCRECAEECEKHDHDHCSDCADACRDGQEACEMMET